MKLIQNYIDGRFVSGKSEFADINPADGTTIAQVTEAGESQVDEAVYAARRALLARLTLRDGLVIGNAPHAGLPTLAGL